MMRSTIHRVLVVLLASTLLTSGLTVAATNTQPAITVAASTTTVTPGETTTLSYTITNAGENDSVPLALDVNESALPDGWTVTDHGGSADTYSSSSQEFVYYSIGANSNASGTLTLQVPANASRGNYTIPATVITAEREIATVNATVTVTSPIAIHGTNSTVTQGETTTVEFTLENTGSTALPATINVNESSLPDSWTITDVSNTADAYKNTSYEFTYFSIAPNSSVAATLTLAVPANTSPGEYAISATAIRTSGIVDQTTLTVTVTESVIETYDTDENNEIGTTEALAGISAWQHGSLNTQNALAIIAAWQST
ncbi:NEW3 domain-containing protein [Salarchaeum sp. JOR-1]|uniref:NEW3 domain-containing protein n=1 Tax=Salarchaeum sp. JOR-1 TaxID=2599399 RepID=UPI001198BB0C|nr:NEW3 domain-containing protein [Salarchaeum sp. JOR-1]QDX40793.1 hypothetical protein FQU85_07685 [Salarchaeum sp. JOR-1]